VSFNIFGNVSNCAVAVLVGFQFRPVFHRFNTFPKWKQMNKLKAILLSILDTRMMFVREISNILWPQWRNGFCDESMFALANMISNGCWIFWWITIYLHVCWSNWGFFYRVCPKNRFDQIGGNAWFEYQLFAQCVRSNKLLQLYFESNKFQRNTNSFQTRIETFNASMNFIFLVTNKIIRNVIRLRRALIFFCRFRFFSSFSVRRHYSPLMLVGCVCGSSGLVTKRWHFCDNLKSPLFGRSLAGRISWDSPLWWPR